MSAQTAKATIWHFCNIYPTAMLGRGVSVGSYTEIGNNVIIGDRTRIGAHSFIPEGVLIGPDCFIGPGVTFTNDRFPPSPKNKWQRTTVCRRAAIGAGCIILPGVTIGFRALIGAGSVVTKNVPPNEIWAGNPAKKLRRREPMP